MIIFACFSPHPPILLPGVGSKKDQEQVKQTIVNLKLLGKKLKRTKLEKIIISSPHDDWGFNVPLYFLTPDFKGGIETYLTGLEEPKFYFKEGKEIYKSKIQNQKSKIALIGSGDLSHRLKSDGPYGLHPDGPKFDQALIKCLEEKEIEGLLRLGEQFPEAGECGLRSFAFILGVLSNIDYEPEILSYEAPFGVGYLVANFKL